MAERYASGPEAAADLVHEVVLWALDRGIDDWETPRRRAWMRGALRKRAAFVARTAARRRAREQAVAAPLDPALDAPRRLAPEALARLPPSLRRLARLLAADLRREELAYLLGTSDQAFRQRLSGLRRELARLGEEAMGAAASPPDGRCRAPLIEATRRRKADRVIGTHDPDGHLLLFAEGA